MIVRTILGELKDHAPFTALGALSGIVLMFLLRTISREMSLNLFYTFHPIHVLLSAMVTAAMYQRHKCGRFSRCNIWVLMVIGYVGSIGIATLSDSLIPYAGEILLNMPHRHAHIGFIEKWWLINPLAILGVMIAYHNPTTRFPHYGHVFLSTWASLFHLLAAIGTSLSAGGYAALFLFLFVSVWLPCCVSDIVFPLLFVGRDASAGPGEG